MPASSQGPPLEDVLSYAPYTVRVSELSPRERTRSLASKTTLPVPRVL